ncbi:11980_t:CDS:2 [Entrophospora sp. SA101]|nr:11980_t:CDS:2 [Entrophospora sp. SA101]
MSEINEDDEDNQEEYDKESPEEFDKATTMEGNIPQCVRYIIQIIGWINNVASSDDINAKNKLLNLLKQVFKNFNTEVFIKSIVQDFTSTESIVEESSISSNNLIVPRPTLFLLSVAFRVNKISINENLQSN